MITELVYQTEHVSVKVYQRVGDLSCGGFDEKIYISLFCNKTLLSFGHSFYYNNKNISIMKYYLGKAEQLMNNQISTKKK
jgi:hypothetical protein